MNLRGIKGSAAALTLPFIPESTCQNLSILCIQCYHNYVLQFLMCFASFLIEVNEFLRTLSNRELPNKDRQVIKI